MSTVFKNCTDCGAVNDARDVACRTCGRRLDGGAFTLSNDPNVTRACEEDWAAMIEPPRAEKRAYSIESPDQQALKIARAKIEAVLKEHDIAAVVVLHTPGMVEFFHDVTPSYSCIWIDDTLQALGVRSRLADYGGDRAAQLRDQQATANMAHGLADQLAHAARMLQGISLVVDRMTRAEHTGATMVPDPAEGRKH